MGDVAMLIQVLYAVARANEQHEFILLTQPFLTELLLDAPDNVEAMAIDIRREEHSFLGLVRYAQRLRREHFDAVLDLHDVLRTKCLRGFLRLTDVPCQHLVKPRRERRRLVADDPKKDLTPLPPMWSLYQQVFRSAGLTVPEGIPPVAIHPSIRSTFERLHPELLSRGSERIRLGIAPFASTPAKTYDLGLMLQAVRQLEETERFETANQDISRVGEIVGQLFVFLFPATMLVLDVTMVGVIWFGGHQVDSGRGAGGTLAALTLNDRVQSIEPLPGLDRIGVG